MKCKNRVFSVLCLVVAAAMLFCMLAGCGAKGNETVNTDSTNDTVIDTAEPDSTDSIIETDNGIKASDMKSDSAEAALAKYIAAQKQLDGEAMYSLVPADFHEYKIDELMNGRVPHSREEAEVFVRNNYNPENDNPANPEKDLYDIIYRAGFLSSEEADVVLSYETIDSYTASADEVEALNTWLYEKCSFESKVTEAVVYCNVLKVTAFENGEQIDDFVEDPAICITMKIGSDWYLINSGDVFHFPMWIDRQGLMVNDSVKWIEEKVTEFDEKVDETY